MTGPTFLYLHGFASSPQSGKARAFEAWGREHGIAFDVLDLRVPSFEGLRFSAIKARVREAIGAGSAARAVLVGSSLGGLTACRVAEEDPRVCAVIAMAPAFQLAQGWRGRLGEEGWARWMHDGTLEVDDWATGTKARIEHGFVDELSRIDVGFPDVRVPTLVLHGTKDEIVPVAQSREWARGKRHVRLVELEDGHELGASVPLLLDEAFRFLRPFGVR
ncbi:MAG: hypothetical protein JWP97_3537 [Labilithrix sp.]|nr:hypothetical protein [Labilithrix sp.]